MHSYIMKTVRMLLLMQVLFFTKQAIAIEVDAGPDEVTCEGLNVTLGLLDSQGDTAWGGATGIGDCTDYRYEWYYSWQNPEIETPFAIEENPTIAVEETTTFYLIVYDCNGNSCSDTKTVIISGPTQKVPLGRSITTSASGTGCECFKVYVPTKHGGVLNAIVTEGTGYITKFYKPIDQNGYYPSFVNNTEVGENQHGWYTFMVEEATGIYTVGSIFGKTRRVQKRPWNFYWWSIKGDHIEDDGNEVADTEISSGSDDNQHVALNTNTNGKDIILCGLDGILQSSPSFFSDDKIDDMINLFSVDGDYTPLMKYDNLFNTNVRDACANRAKNTNDRPRQYWEGICGLVTLASIWANPPQPDPASGINQDELESLWGLLAERGVINGTTTYIGNPCPPLIPTSGFDDTDIYARYFHAIIEQEIKMERTYGLYTNLRSEDTTDPNSVWNHAIWQYETIYEEAGNYANEQVINVKIKLWTNKDTKPPTDTDQGGLDETDPTINRIVEYEYDIGYDIFGEIQYDYRENWISVGGQAVFPPQIVIKFDNPQWGSNIYPELTIENVEQLDLAN